SAPPKSIKPTERGYSFSAAVRAAEVLSTQHLGNIDGGGYQSIKKAKKKEQAQALEREQELEGQTLKKLLLAYCDHLQNLGKISHQEARNVLRLHVIEAFPKLAQSPASQITTEQVADVMRRLIQDGKPSSFRNSLCRLVTASIFCSNETSSKFTAPRSTSSSASAVLTYREMFRL
ncbi:integrase, partial [Comamonas aquatica]|nr:integrase [Comamonas aquatica]